MKGGEIGSGREGEREGGRPAGRQGEGCEKTVDTVRD